MESTYLLKDFHAIPSAAATQNACKLCAPLGAALVFKGIRGAVPLLHGSQGCATYIRRYLISHFNEPIDIACSNFGETTAIFGGGANIKLALDNIIAQYAPCMIGVATTCLAETIGDDVSMFIREYRSLRTGVALPPIVNVSTPSYKGTHMQGFHDAVMATVVRLVNKRNTSLHRGSRSVNLFPGMVSPADLRHLKQIVSDFELKAMVLPDYSRTLDGGLWTEYHAIPDGGTPVEDIVDAGTASASVELGHVLAEAPATAATYLWDRFGVSCHRLALPIGIRRTDRFMETLASVSHREIPAKYTEERGRLLDSLVDGHKYVNGLRAAVYGEADLVAGVVEFLSEIGVLPVVCATGEVGECLAPVIMNIISEKLHEKVHVMEGADFVDMEQEVRARGADLLIGHSKGYSLARKLDIPLVRIGFPIHDRVDGSRLLHLGYRGAQSLFDRIANAVIEKRQSASDVGYTYM